MKKSVDLLKGKYTKVDPNKIKHSINNELNGMNYTEVNNEDFSQDNDSDDLQEEIAIKEPPAHIQRKKKITMSNSNKNSTKKFSNNGSKNTWVKKVKKNLDFNGKNKPKINKLLTENDEEDEEIIEQSEEINEIKESVMCYICLSKVVQPKMCPNCQKIACKECLRNWFIVKENKNCGYCRAEMSFDKMISVPVLDSVANLIEKISVKNSQILQHYPQINRSIVLNKRVIQDDNNITNNNRLTFRNLGNTYERGKKYKKKVAKMAENNINDNNDNDDIDFCEKHNDQPLYYYCLDCNKGYCRTCFVFFGEEKDKHNDHKIIEYKKFKSNSITLFEKEKGNLEDKCEELNAYIKRCEALKECYEFERKIVLNYIKKIIETYNNEVDENITILESIIKTYSNYLEQIENCLNDISKVNSNIKINKDFTEILMNKISNINEIKYFNSKEIDTYSDLSKNININVYQTKLKKFDIKQKSFHYKIPLSDTNKYNLSITQKGNEVQIYIYWPEEKNIEFKYNLLPFIFIRRKNKNWESFQLTEFLNYKGNNYYIKRFNANNFCAINSYFKIKGVLYENLIEPNLS